MIMNIKQRKFQIEPKTKLNYNIYIKESEMTQLELSVGLDDNFEVFCKRCTCVASYPE